ncbi:pheromone A receptor-domain-containing protein [Pterulicium gracile]|uniref:Pheromone A receptor-domain-containing protein n=1 Tax=Pterulicium gracile TaxID=1884261 RepID=A0A5C3Q2R3_9AGAR|nr:pheromone A receptor-domain-containing protein [Pterula gracilis]
MRLEQPFFSFLSSALLIVSILVSRPIRTNFLHVCLISWLFSCNVVHGVNSLIWAGNTELHFPVWCDIVTKLLFGFHIALPAASVCIARHLELLSSSRKVSDDPLHRRARFIVNVALCITLPLVFTSLHVIVQDHRFDLTADYGCSPSTHSSLLALSITWIPVLIMCSILFVFSGALLQLFTRALVKEVIFSIYRFHSVQSPHSASDQAQMAPQLSGIHAHFIFFYASLRLRLAINHRFHCVRGCLCSIGTTRGLVLLGECPQKVLRGQRCHAVLWRH